MLVVDASIAAKWVFAEPDSERALALATREASIAAPALILAELANVAWKRVRKGAWGAEDASESVLVAAGMFTLIVPIEELWIDALALSLRLDHPIYDCFYLALARQQAAPIASADTRMIGIAEAIGLVIEPY